ncbi:MAG: DNRLRE domain-containing protein [Planctomycetota bacterium]|nr:DNRLRE domain-containing protein [Planctomycetota bacterium]
MRRDLSHEATGVEVPGGLFGAIAQLASCREFKRAAVGVPETDGGDGSEWLVAADGIADGDTRETYLRFDASEAIVAGNAELHLRVAGRGSDAGTTSFVIELMQPPATPWQEDGLTWSQRPSTVLRTGARFTCAAQIGEDLVIDVSDLIQAAADADILPRTTLRIRSTQSGSQRYVAFDSDEAVGGTPPRLRWLALIGNG